jgi:hypothetical protein
MCLISKYFWRRLPAFISNGIPAACYPAWLYGSLLQILSEKLQSFETGTGASRFCVCNYGIYCPHVGRYIFQGERYGSHFSVEYLIAAGMKKDHKIIKNSRKQSLQSLILSAGAIFSTRPGNGLVFWLPLKYLECSPVLYFHQNLKATQLPNNCSKRDRLTLSLLIQSVLLWVAGFTLPVRPTAALLRFRCDAHTWVAPSPGRKIINVLSVPATASSF